MAQGDFDRALSGLLRADAPLSASTIAQLKEKWQEELPHWQIRSLEELEAVYLGVDGLYVKVGLEKQGSPPRVLAALSNGQKVVLAVVPGHQESTARWSVVLRDLKTCGLCAPRLVIRDGHLGIWTGRAAECLS